MSLGSLDVTTEEFAQGAPRDLTNGLRRKVLIRTSGIPPWKCLNWLRFYRRATRGSNLAGCQGRFPQLVTLDLRPAKCHEDSSVDDLRPWLASAAW